MIYILIGYLIGIILGIKFKINNCIIAFLAGFCILLLLSKIQIKGKEGKIINSTKSYALFSVKKAIVVEIAIILSCVFTLYKINKFDNKYKSGDTTLEVTIISRDVNTDYYNKYLCKNSSGDKFILKIKKDIDINLEVQNKIKINGNIKLPPLNKNDGTFNYRRYLNSQNIYGTITVSNSKIELLNEGKIDFITKIKYKIEETFTKFLPNDYAGIINGMLNGDTKNVSEDILNDFKNSGVTHLLAVSGSNIAYIVIFLTVIFNKIFGKHFSYYIILGSIIIFIFVSGSSASVVRAGVMAILNIIATLLSKKSNTLNNVFVSALFLLCINPLTIYDVGFILSFVGTLGIIIISPKLNSFIYKYIKNKNISDTIGVTLSAQIMLMPLMVYYFNTFSVLSLLTNFLIVPVSGFLTILGFITVLIGTISMRLASIISFSIYTLITFMIKITSIFGNIKWSNILVPTPKIWMIVFYYTIIFLNIRPIKNKRRIYKIMLLFCIIYVVISNLPRSYIKINMLDVGQGDSIYVETENKKIILIDGGGTEGSEYDIGEKILLPYILAKGKKEIELIVVSHPHEDHIEGVLTMIEKLTVKKVVISENIENEELTLKLIKLCKDRNTQIVRVSKGDKFIVDNIKFMVIHPDKKEYNSNLNNMSLLMKMEYAGIKILFTGDLEKEKEEKINSNLKADILKVGHHGSITSTSEKFIKKVSPKIALISVGEDNSYGHPSLKVLDRLKKVGAQIYRTDLFGEIKFQVTKKGKIIKK